MKRFFRFGPLEKDRRLSRSFISLISYGSVVHNQRLKIELIFKMYWAFRPLLPGISRYVVIGPWQICMPIFETRSVSQV